MENKKFPLFLKITGILCITGGILMIPIVFLLTFAPQSFGRSLELLQINLFPFLDLLGTNIVVGIGLLRTIAIIGFVAIFFQKKFGYSILRIMGLLSAAILFFFVVIKSYFSDNLYMIIIGAMICIGMLMTVGMLLYEYKKPSRFFRRTLLTWLLTMGSLVLTIILLAEPSQQHLLAYGQPIDYTKVVNYRVVDIEPFTVLTGERSYLTGSLSKIGLLFPLLLLLIWYADRKYTYIPSQHNNKKWYLMGGILVGLLAIFSGYYRGYFLCELKLPEIVPDKFHKIGYQEVASDKNFYIQARQLFGDNESFLTKEFESSLFITKGMSGGKIIYAETTGLFASFNNQYSGTINKLITDIKEINQLTGMVPYTDTEIRKYGGLRGAVIILNASAYSDCVQGNFNQCRDTWELIYTFIRKLLEAGDSSINVWGFLSMNKELISGLQEILALPNIPKGLFNNSLVQQPYNIANIQHNMLVQEYFMNKEWAIDNLERENAKNNIYIPTAIFDAKQTEHILKAYFSIEKFDEPELFFQHIGYTTRWGLPRYNAGGFLILSNILPRSSNLQSVLVKLEHQRTDVLLKK